MPVYATFEHDPATCEWRIPTYWVDADGRMRLDGEDVRKVVLRRRELRPLPWPVRDDEPDRCYCAGCIGMGPCDNADPDNDDDAEPCDTCSGYGCAECEDDDSLPADADYAWRDGHAVLVETETALSEAGLL